MAIMLNCLAANFLGMFRNAGSFNLPRSKPFMKCFVLKSVRNRGSFGYIRMPFARLNAKYSNIVSNWVLEVWGLGKMRGGGGGVVVFCW